jgi:hypothetical protein
MISMARESPATVSSIDGANCAAAAMNLLMV